MPDVFTKAKRSAVMSRIRGSGNRDTELRLIALFRAHGISGWRRRMALFGKPDFVFRRERVVVFVDAVSGTGIRGADLLTRRKAGWSFGCRSSTRTSRGIGS
jgi:hypothetical protein